ncbi:spondin-1 isoform X4 [Biomphalaria glabrata]|uniref:Spondin-1 n=1 Tax=Biomphalaria glabrata TaxID=6526 RepID=A0A9W3AQZ1_BIOGL|nr:spondin-1 isoform X4 [Biomphalaria glabrata]
MADIRQSVTMTTVFLLLCLLCFSADGNIASYVKQICERKPIHTTADKTVGDNGFRIIFEGLPGPDTYRPGETYTVIINGSTPQQRLMGLMVTATATDKKGATFVPGTFNTTADIRVQDLKEDKTCDESVIAHRYLVNKNGVFFRWTAPVPGTGCIHFNATVIERSDVWYKDEGSLHKVICEETAQEDSASAINNDPPNPQDECCACGHAMYTVEFKGLWSRNTHPKGFIEDKYSYQLHWSNIVGATHGTDYRIWEYGQYASRAVKEVCEYGSSRSLENEMKENSDKIRTVIKTNQLWGPDKILESVKAVYTVNKQKHFLSLITMVGPSPDWCLGLSSQSMCTANCTWKDHLEIDLYPWDAGTDSRVTYLGRKIPTQPPERIHRLSSNIPNDAESPFYGIDIKPFARLTITKNKEACTDDDGRSNSAESPSTDELVSMMKKKMMEKKKFDMEKCATSLWSDWSECSNPCGAGQRDRRRMLKNPGVTKDMCDLELTETEACTGPCKEKRKKLHDSYVMRHDDERDPSDLCAVTNWSDWSPCSATCGLGMKERWRMFLHNTEKRVDCGVHLMEKDLCRGEIYDCQKAMMMKNFTAICQQEADVGPCRGDFPRWFYNHTMEKCQIFSYGGCRGNENRFETEKECVDLCAEHMADIFRKEHMMVKQEMPNKQMEMERQIMMEKERMMANDEMKEKAKTMEEDMRRKELMMQKQKMEEENRIEQENAMKKNMMLPNQQEQDETIPAFEVTSNEETDVMRKEKKVQRKRDKWERRLDKKRRQKGSERKTNLSDGPVIDCMVTPWSEWTPCSVTCGKGFITKTRMIKILPQNGGRKCPKKLSKKKKCKERKCHGGEHAELLFDVPSLPLTHLH